MIYRQVGGKTFSRIYVAIHEAGASTTDTVTDYAIKILQDYDAHLVILHVIRTDVNLHDVNLPSHVMEMRKQVQAYFSKIAEKIHEDSFKENIRRIRTEIIASDRIANAIIGYAKDKHIELIIIGTRNRSKLKSILLGSVATDVVKYARSPVLTVK